MRMDKNGNEILEGDKVKTLSEMDGLPVGATGRVAIYNRITGDPLSRRFGAGDVLLHLDPPWDRTHGYRSDRYQRANELPHPDSSNHWFVSQNKLEIITPLSSEEYTPEDEELFE